VNGFWQHVAASMQSGSPVFIALVVSHTNHSPGTTGARLCVSGDGASFGTIGGGIMEFNVMALARRALSRKYFSPVISHLSHRKTGPGEPSGMMCAGRQSNLYYLCQPDVDGSAIISCAAAIRADRPGVLTITPDGISFSDEPDRCHGTSPEPEFATAGSLYTERDSSWSYREQLLNLRRVALLGGGHCAHALARILVSIDYHVEIYDPRPVVSLPVEANLDGIHVFSGIDMLETGRSIAHPSLTEVVVMGTDSNTDILALRGVLHLPFPYIGVMGSPAKIAHIRRALSDEGISVERIDRMTAPVGIPIGSRTPSEIAVSIAAQLIERRRMIDD